MMERVNSAMIFLIYCKNFYKSPMYPQHNNKKGRKINSENMKKGEILQLDEYL
jgi:hypothetical protein